MTNALTNLVPVFNRTNYQDWAPCMKNYLLSAGQWRQMAKEKPEPDYPYHDIEVPITGSDGKPDTEIVSKVDFSQDPKNQSEIDSWDNNNNKARGNIMLRLHCQGGPRRSPEIQSTLVWSSCWGATGSAGRSTQGGE